MNSSFDRIKSGKDEWLTPKYLIDVLGPFDLDPCSPINRPWQTASTHYTINDNGLNQLWYGSVWCNPPYGNETKKWLNKCAKHKNAIALIFARTETKMFFDSVWDKADALFFIKGRIKFFHVDGTEGGPAGAPSVLVAYGKQNAERLKKINIDGKFIQLR